MPAIIIQQINTVRLRLQAEVPIRARYAGKLIKGMMQGSSLQQCWLFVTDNIDVICDDFILVCGL